MQESLAGQGPHYFRARRKRIGAWLHMSVDENRDPMVVSIGIYDEPIRERFPWRNYVPRF
jgi:hypothetical protein